MNSSLVLSSFYITYVFLLTTTCITFIEALRSPIPTVRHIMNVETCISIIASYFYGVFIEEINKVQSLLRSEKEVNIPIEKINTMRYIDWAITTPTMLITLICYLIYLNKRAENKTSELEFFTILKDNSTTIIPVIILNWLMLLFGYLGEMKFIPVFLGVLLGFIPFLVYYYIIYVNYVTQSESGYLLFWYFFFFWSLYGVVAGLPYYLKNSFYNILDLFAKNFFGIFLSYIIFSGNY
jgi:bacteriorhodopsin